MFLLTANFAPLGSPQDVVSSHGFRLILETPVGVETYQADLSVMKWAEEVDRRAMAILRSPFVRAAIDGMPPFEAPFACEGTPAKAGADLAALINSFETEAATREDAEVLAALKILDSALRRAQEAGIAFDSWRRRAIPAANT
ncbi:hypothetical protein [Paludisphaera mucosa]|uniref:Gfo/Idh/MocA-like oxidoreductase C-terminal domain-containing protein n=1 Tax=Paludisphaera mucosa TaxID=3030827 RepID=A0ABT6F6J4_9BACT|nr:hypothetical protein [Paludisphaera mucosa]MDG3003207.1 hypothetical protein [Paludisphaera mucosa]